MHELEGLQPARAGSLAGLASKTQLLCILMRSRSLNVSTLLMQGFHKHLQSSG